MSDPRPSVDEIDALLRDRVVELVSHLTGTGPNRHLSRTSEARFGRKGGIAVTTAGRDKGRITLFDGDGKGRSPFQFIQDEQGLDFGAAVGWAANWLGINNGWKPGVKTEAQRRAARDVDRQKADVEARGEIARKQDVVNSIVAQSVPVEGTPVERYLHNRSISAWSDDIRYHPNSEKGYGAMVAIARDQAGEIRATQRVFIIWNGLKAGCNPAKRTNGSVKGAALRLPGIGPRLYLAEGPETALSVWLATKAPTWAVLGQNFIRDDIPNDIEEIVIAADNDAEGSPAFKLSVKAAEHFGSLGHAAYVVRPDGPPKYDFNDVHQERGANAIREILEAAPRWIGPPALYKAPIGTIDTARWEVATFITDWGHRTVDNWARKAEFDGAAGRK